MQDGVCLDKVRSNKFIYARIIIVNTPPPPPPPPALPEVLPGNYVRFKPKGGKFENVLLLF